MTDAEAQLPVKQQRLNKCHTFAWSRQLWGDAAKRTGRVGLVLVVGYLIMGFFLLGYLDGMRGVDPWYFLAITLTTVGLGDLSPSKQVTRGFAIFLLPFGLIVISFGISLAAAQANATAKPLPSELRSMNSEAEARKQSEHQARLLRKLQQDPTASTNSKAEGSSGGEGLSSFDGKSPTHGNSEVEGRYPRMMRHHRAQLQVWLENASFVWSERANRFRETLTCKLLFLAAEYLLVLTAGVAVMFCNSKELRLQKRNNSEDGDEPFTFVDGLYFATVLATTVGYGHIISPQTDTAKGILIAYVFFATYKVGEIIGELSGLYLSIKEEKINDLMMDSTTWIHKADLDRDGRISQADYVLFKLQQMQKVDLDTLNRLIDRFEDLDVGCEGRLDIGTDVPSAEQVAEMQRVVGATGKSMPELWRELQPEIMNHAQALADAEQKWPGEDLDPELLPGGKLYVKLSECHDFQWSRSLWAAAAKETAYLSLVMVVFYLGLGWYLMSYLDEIYGVKAWYSLSATLTTVGFGDFAPTTQTSRGFAIIMIPFGLVIIGFGLSYGVAYARGAPIRTGAGVAGAGRARGAKAVVSQMSKSATLRMVNEERAERRRSSLKNSLGGTEGETRGEDGQEGPRRVHSTSCAVVAAELRASSSGDARVSLLESAHTSDGPFADLKAYWADFEETPGGKSVILIAKLVIMTSVGAVFFKTYTPETDKQELTWVDAYYWAMVTATSIGYGDIVPQTDGGRLFLCFYMLFSTVITANLLGEFIDLYVEGIVGEDIIFKIMDSTTWVHKADLGKVGFLSEADYVMFKLQQMQKVDAEMLDNLIDRFEELDVEGEGYLDVGYDIPSAEQVQEMKAFKEQTQSPKTLIELWEEKKAEIVKTMGGDTKSAVYSAGGTRRPSQVLMEPSKKADGNLKRPSSDFGDPDLHQSLQSSIDSAPVSADVALGSIEMAPVSSTS